MKKTTPQNQEIDQIRSNILKAVRMADDEIDAIVSSPHLFASVRLKIAVETQQIVGPSVSRDQKRYFGFRWQDIAAASGTALAAAAMAVALISYMEFPSPEENEQGPLTEIAAIETVERDSPRPDENNNEQSARTPRKHRVEVARAVSTRTQRRTTRAAAEDEMGEFQALTFADDPDGRVEGSQIVSVELPRASLYAMGIDIPVENGSENIRTDLLIGSDGVMKALRIGKKD